MKTLRYILLILGCIVSGVFVSEAQNTFTASGRLIDAETEEGVAGVVIEVSPAAHPDSKRYYTTEYGGHFRIPGLKPGTYNCTTQFLGYEPKDFEFKITYLPKDVGTLRMRQSAINIDVVVKEVVATRTQMLGDTLRYNADAFKVAADAEVEDLLKKMPGITIQNGRIEAHGEVVKQIYIDGSEFFGGNIQQALQSIPAQAVEHIEVYNRLSDAAQVTGVDDGEGGKVINIVTKGSLNRSQFGKMHVGLGVEPNANTRLTDKFKYTGGGSVNVFRDDMRFTAMALVNNLNKQNFSDDGMSVTNSSNSNNASRTYSVNSQNGIARAELAAFNYIDRWGKRKRIKFEGNLYYNHLNAKNDFTIDRWYNAPAKIDTAHYDQFANPDNHTLRFRGRMEWKLAKRQRLLFNPNISFTHNHSVNSVDTTSTRWGQSGIRYMPSGNSGLSRTYSLNLYAQYQYKFLKQGRIALLVFSFGHSNTDTDRDYYSYSGKVWPVDPLTKYSYQRRFQDASTTNLRLQPTWRERLGRYTTLNVTYRLHLILRDRDLLNYKTDPDYIVDPARLITKTSSSYYGVVTTQQAGVGFRYNKHKNWFTLSAMVQDTKLSNRNLWLSETKTHSYLHPAYNATLQWSFSPRNTIRVSCNSEVKAPGLWSMLDVFDMSNTSYLSRGNSDLKPYCEYNFFGRYTHIAPTKGITFMVMGKAEYLQDYIGSKIAYSPMTFTFDGSKYSPLQVSKPVNLSGRWTYEGRVGVGLPLKTIKSNLNLSAGATYSKIPIEIVNGDTLDLSVDTNFDTPGAKEMMKNLSGWGQVVLGSNISENVDFTIDWRGTYSNNRSSLAMMNNKYFTHTARANVKIVLPLGFTITTMYSYTQYVGFTNDYNDDFMLWNISVGKKVLNRLGEIEFCVHDALDQNKSFGRSVWSGYSQIRYNSVIGRYFLLKFTYNLRSIVGGMKRMQVSTGVPVNRFAATERRLNQLLKF